MDTSLSLVENRQFNNSLDLEEKQESFLKNSFGSIVNNALDICLRALLPDMIENQVIEVKDTILESGLKEGLNKAVENAINLGKSASGIVTGKFESIEQIDMAIKKGGIVDTVSDILDTSIKNVQEKKLIDKNIASLIKKGKNTIINSITENIEDTINTQVKSIKKVEEYSSKWKTAYESRDFETMTKSYNNMEKYLKQTMPLENTIKEARKIENLHNLIKNNGKNFDISEEEIKLSEKLVN